MKKLLELILEEVEANGGCTINARLHTLSKGNSGYHVAITDNLMPTGKAEMIRELNLLNNLAIHLNYNIGAWQDSDGKLYIDLVKWVANIEQAESLGRFCKQKSIYDVHKKEVIYL